jgi:hypothetical protein
MEGRPRLSSADNSRRILSTEVFEIEFFCAFAGLALKIIEITKRRMMDSFCMQKDNNNITITKRLIQSQCRSISGNIKIKMWNLDFIPDKKIVHGKGVDADLTDNHNGSFMTYSHDPFCEIREKHNKKIIEYFLLFNEKWNLEIKSHSADELVGVSRFNNDLDIYSTQNQITA